MKPIDKPLSECCERVQNFYRIRLTVGEPKEPSLETIFENMEIALKDILDNWSEDEIRDMYEIERTKYGDYTDMIIEPQLYLIRDYRNSKNASVSQNS